MSLLSLSEASIQPRTSPLKFACSPCTDLPGVEDPERDITNTTISPIVVQVEVQDDASSASIVTTYLPRQWFRLRNRIWEPQSTMNVPSIAELNAHDEVD